MKKGREMRERNGSGNKMVWGRGNRRDGRKGEGMRRKCRR